MHQWRDLLDDYLISESGVIVNKKTKRVLKQQTNQKGYKFLMLRFNGKTITRQVHRFVYEAFVGEILPSNEINHIDGNKVNNHYTNLQQISHRDNIIHAVENGLIKSGFANNRSKPVVQLDLYGRYVAVHGSINLAAKNIGKHQSLISLCANGHRKSAYGYIFVHLENYK